MLCSLFYYFLQSGEFEKIIIGNYRQKRIKNRKKVKKITWHKNMKKHN